MCVGKPRNRQARGDHDIQRATMTKTLADGTYCKPVALCVLQVSSHYYSLLFMIMLLSVDILHSYFITMISHYK